jgi:uncharacterized protein YndB with AHSA1/START domain
MSETLKAGATLQLTVTKTIAAGRRELFEAWLSPEALAAFIRPGPGVTVPTAQVDARVGGSFLIVMRVGDTDIEHRGEYLEISPHERLVFTWLSGMTVPDSTVTIDFKDLPDGRTEVALHHVGFPSEESRGNHEGGWTMILDTLADTLA